MIRRHIVVASPLGALTLVAQGQALVGLHFERQSHFPDAASLGEAASLQSDSILAHVANELDEYFAGDRTTFSFEVQTFGDDFSERVWRLLRSIPYGETTTYGQLARAMGNPGLAQRVGGVVGRNPVGIVIPCHRVIGADGLLTGYAGGLDRKRWLLELEEPEALRASRLF
ncbi:methylated-DNA--[protein]-cysteine S-methyltransferase [Rarobacter incanus]|uniref:Methylated-DNA--protein-cysteine methyltransferase n=1 Tax=Rarobacter incanus TaxID=153494 RepID=A0A542SMR0_9MICO|nr:methylated-DNA--[protein]-cysteine S-methyltransferase [Rarobacter incanus]TQK75858.1 methylated-DNA-[protein]-cysteine S-methyltransferase [Rarobacter incanus]